MEKVGFPQVGRRLLLEVSPGQTHSAGTTKSRVSGSPDGAASRPPGPLPAQCLPPQGPCGTPMGSPGTEHPSLTPPQGSSLRAGAKRCSRAATSEPRGTGSAARPRPHPALRAARSPEHPPRHPQPAPTNPPRGPWRLAAGPAWRGALSPCGALPRGAACSCHFSKSARSCHRSAHVPYLSVSVLLSLSSPRRSGG